MVHVVVYVLPCFLGGLKNLLSMLVGADIEKDVLARKAPTARERIRLNEFQGVPDMRIGIHIRKCGGEVATHLGRLRSALGFLAALHVVQEFAQSRGNRHRKQYAEEPGQGAAGDKSEYDHEWRDA